MTDDDNEQKLSVEAYANSLLIISKTLADNTHTDRNDFINNLRQSNLIAGASNAATLIEPAEMHREMITAATESAISLLKLLKQLASGAAARSFK